MGYKDNSPYKKEKSLTVKSNKITMKGVSMPLLLEPDLGAPVVGLPNMDYLFPGATQVKETPLQKYKKGGQTDELVGMHLQNLNEKEKKEFYNRYLEMPDNERKSILHALRLQYPQVSQKYNEDYYMMSDKEFQEGGKINFMKMDTGMIPIGSEINVMTTDDQRYDQQRITSPTSGERPAPVTNTSPTPRQAQRAQQDVAEAVQRTQAVQSAQRAEVTGMSPDEELMSQIRMQSSKSMLQPGQVLPPTYRTQVDSTPEMSRQSTNVVNPALERLSSNPEEYNFNHLRRSAGTLPKAIQDRLTLENKTNSRFSTMKDPVTGTTLIKDSQTNKFIVGEGSEQSPFERTVNYKDTPMSVEMGKEHFVQTFERIRKIPGYLPKEVSDNLVKVRDMVDRDYELFKHPASGGIEVLRDRRTGKYVLSKTY